MRLKARYKSCLLSKTNIWGDLLSKENSYLKPKWDGLLAQLRTQKKRYRPLVHMYRRRHPLWFNYYLLKPRTRPNQVFKYNRFNFKNTLLTLMCVRRFYGDLNHNYLKKVCLSSAGSSSPIEDLVGVLESRLDVCLYRLGFFHTVYYSRQAICHQGILINGKKINNPGFTLQKGDHVSFCPEHKESIKARLIDRYKLFRNSQVKLERWRLSNRHKLNLHLAPTPKWIQTDYPSLSFIISAKVSPPAFYPFRINLDEAIWSSKYSFR